MARVHNMSPVHTGQYFCQEIWLVEKLLLFIHSLTNKIITWEDEAQFSWPWRWRNTAVVLQGLFLWNNWNSHVGSHILTISFFSSGRCSRSVANCYIQSVHFLKFPNPIQLQITVQSQLLLGLLKGLLFLNGFYLHSMLILSMISLAFRPTACSTECASMLETADYVRCLMIV